MPLKRLELVNCGGDMYVIRQLFGPPKEVINKLCR